MGRHSPNDAEKAFFGAVLSDAPLRKTAEDSGPADALGIATVSPRILKELEGQAAQVAQQPQTPQEEPPPAEQSVQPAGEPAQEFAEASPEDTPPEEELPPEPELPSRLTHGKLFSNKEAHPLQVFDVLNMRYQTKWVDWEPETLWWALRRDFGPVGDLMRNKIGALRVAATTDVPWGDWDVFENSGLAWSGTIPMFGAYQPMSPSQTAFAVHILREIRPDEQYEDEVTAYIAAILEENGFVYAPEEFFANAQVLLDRKVWVSGLRAEVEGTWENVRDRDPRDIEWREDNPVDVHVFKLFVVQEYLREWESRREVVPGAPGATSIASPPVS